MRLLLLICALVSFVASAEIPYRELFPDPIASHHRGNANINGQPVFTGGDHRLNFVSVADNSNGSACAGQKCISNGQSTPKLTLPAFQTTKTNQSLRLGRNENVTLSLPGDINHLTIETAANRNVRGGIKPQEYVTRIRQLEVQQGRTLHIHPGVYFVENFILNGTFTVSNREPVLILAKNVNIGLGAQFNPAHEDPYVVGLISYGSINFNGRNNFNAWIYAQNTVNVGVSSRIRGGINAPNVIIQDRSKIIRKDFYMDELVEFDTFKYLDSMPQMVGYWDFNYREDDKQYSYTRDAFDSIYNNHGHFYGGATHMNLSKFCEGVYFNGEGAYLDIPDAKQYRGTDNTIAMWMKTDDIEHQHRKRWGGQFFFSKESQDKDNGGHISTWFEADGSLGLRYQTDREDFYIRTDDELVTEGEWFHFALSMTATRIIMYFNGEEVGSVTVRGKGQKYNHEPIILGASAVWSDDRASSAHRLYDFYNGYMDEFRWYNDALTREQIWEVMIDKPDCEPHTNNNLIAEYRFADDKWKAGKSVKDSSGNGFDASTHGEIRLMTPVNNMSCGVLDVPPNTNQSTPDYIKSEVELYQDVGPQGTFSFWFKSNSGWQDERDRTLLDAVKIHNNNVRDGNNKFFYVALLQNGQLEVGMEDSADRNFRQRTKEAFNTPEHTWVHIAIGYDFAQQKQVIFLNGVEQTLVAIDAKTTWTGLMPEYGNIAFGDNQTDYFAPTRSANGRFDDIRIYDFEQNSEQIKADMEKIEPCSVLSGYYIEHPDQAMTCEAAPITIKACRDKNCNKLYDEPVDLELLVNRSAGTSQTQTLQFTGETTLDVNVTSAETVTLSVNPLYHALPEQLNNKCSNDCEIEFVDAGLQIYEGKKPGKFDDALIGSTVSSYFGHDAGSPLSQYNVRAVYNNENVCKPIFSGNQTLSLQYSCYHELDQQKVQGCAVPLYGRLSGTGPQQTSIQLAFDDNGVASLGALRMDDAVNVVMNLTYTNAQLNVLSNTVDIAFDPVELVLSTNLSGKPVAGEPFAITLNALGANGIMLPSYQYENITIQPIQIAPDNDSAFGQLVFSDALSVLSSSVLSHISQNGKKMRDVFKFDKGSVTIESMHYDETGIVDLQITDDRGTKKLISNTLTLGPFIPAYFSVSHTLVPSFEHGNDTFTYLGQPFTFSLGSEPIVTVTARNAFGQPLYNYHSDDWLLRPDAQDIQDYISLTDNSGSGLTLQIANAPTDPILSGTVQPDGVGQIELSNVDVTYSKPVLPVTPFTPTVSLTVAAEFLTDPDGVCYRTNYPTGGCEDYIINNITGTELRYGRLNMMNAFGPENEALHMPVYVEYFSPAGWVLNAQDDSTNVNFSQSAGQIEITLGADSPNDILSSITGVQSSGFLLNGMAANSNMVFPAPNAIGALQVHLNPAIGAPLWADYLNVDWNGDGVINSADKPSATVNFGMFRGNDRRINFREVMP